MTETGIIESVNKGYAVVKFPRKQACEQCRMCIKHKDNVSVSLYIKNTLNASINDKVIVEMRDNLVLKSAIVVYFIPVILVTLSLIATQALDTLWQFISVIFAIIAGFGISIIVDRHNKKYNKLTATMIKIIEEDNI